MHFCRLRVVSGPAYEAIGESIRVRRCTAGADCWATGPVGRIVARALIRGEPVALGRVGARCLPSASSAARLIGSVGVRGSLTGPCRSVILPTDDSVFGAVELRSIRGDGELSAVSGAGSKIRGGPIRGRAGGWRGIQRPQSAQKRSSYAGPKISGERTFTIKQQRCTRLAGW
jgi:hypothetical protein